MDSFSNRPALRPNPNGRATGVVAVIGLHALLVYGLLTGLHHNFTKVISTPITVLDLPKVEEPPVITRIKPQPPTRHTPLDTTPYQPATDEPQPTSATVSIEAKSEPTATQEVTAPPATAISEAAPPRHTDIGLVCHDMVKPEMPRQAVQNGTTGIVKATAIIRGGVVRDVINLTGPRVFYAAVKTAMLQYRCEAGTGEISATQEFNFQMSE